MRTRHWTGWVTGLALALSAVGPALAQSYPPYSQQVEMALPPSGDALGMYGPSAFAGGQYQGGLPPGAMPYPNVSPYGPYGPGPQLDETTYEKGFWFNRTSNAPRRYYLDVQGTMTQFGRTGNQLLGNNNVSPIGVLVQGTTAGAAGVAATTVVPIVPGSDQVGTVQFFGSPRTANEFQDEMWSGGLRLNGGFFNNDGTGFYINGFFTSEASQGLRVGRDDWNPNDPNTWRLDTQIQVNVGLPPETTNIPAGSAIINDLFTEFSLSNRAYGTSVGWYGWPIYNSSSFKLQPVVAARYLQIRENFQYFGGFSGTSSTYILASSTVNTGGAGTQDQLGSVVASLPILPGDAVLGNPIFTDLRSWTQTQLAGPELGLRYDLGGEKLKLWGQSKFGILANYSERNLSSGNLVAFESVTSQLIPAAQRNNLNPTQESDSTSYVSPMFEQTVGVECYLFRYIPGLKKLSFLEQAKFQYGYTYTLIGNVYRPSDNIEWNAFPLQPRLLNNRSNYWMGQHQVGVEWSF